MVRISHSELQLRLNTVPIKNRLLGALNITKYRLGELNI